MNRFFLLLMMFFAFSICKSQERINNPGITFDKVGKKFTTATGWAYSSSLERWIDYQNTICTSLAFKRSRVAEVVEQGILGVTIGHFSSIICKSFLYEGERFYALFVENWDKKEIYLFNHDYETIFCVEDEVPHQIKVNCIIEGEKNWFESHEDWTDEEYAFYIAKNWEIWPEQNVFHYKKEGGNMRFLISKSWRFDSFYFETSIANFSTLLPL